MKKQDIVLIIVIIVIICLNILAWMSVGKADTQFVCVVRQDEWVWVRSGPSKDAETIEKLRYGYEVSVSEIVNQYAHITWLKGEGWVDVSYLEQPAQEKMYRVNTESGPLAKRETPDGRLLCWIKHGAKISVLGWRYDRKGELWAKVYKGGYVKASYLAEVE